jgi:hypothetical protein
VALNTAINDPNNIYVRAGEVGGNGSIAHPFGTIIQGIAAVNIGGTIYWDRQILYFFYKKISFHY